MSDRRYHAKLAALSLMHGASLAKLLRAHGRATHADRFEAALGEAMNIIASKVGKDELAAAMDWASDQVWPEPAHSPGPSIRQ